MDKILQEIIDELGFKNIPLGVRWHLQDMLQNHITNAYNQGKEEGYEDGYNQGLQAERPRP